MQKLLLTRILQRPNTSVEFYKFDDEDLSILKIWQDAGIYNGITDTLSEDGLALTRVTTYRVDVNNYETLTSIYNSPELESVNIKAIEYCSVHNIIRTCLLFNIVDEDGTVLWSGDHPEKL